MKQEFSTLVNRLTYFIGNGDDKLSNEVSSVINQAVLLWTIGRLTDGVNLLINELERVSV